MVPYNLLYLIFERISKLITIHESFNQKEVCFIVKANYIYGTLNQSNEREMY